MKLHKTQKLQRYKGRVVCWATHPDQINETGNARGRVLHLLRIGPKFDYTSTICGMFATRYMVVDQAHDCSTYEGRQLCKPCLGQLESDHVVTDEEPNPQWKGRSVSQWMAEFEKLKGNCQYFDHKCRELSIDLGASKAEAEELHRQIARLREKKPGFLQRAALYLLGGQGER